MTNGRVLIHQLSGGSSGRLSEMETDVNEAKRLGDVILKILSKETEKSVKQIKADLKEDRWMDAKETIKYGIADKILTKLTKAHLKDVRKLLKKKRSK